MGEMTHCEMVIDGHLVGGVCDQTVGKQVVHAPYDGRRIGTAAEGGWSEANTALDAARDAFQTYRGSSRRDRTDLLDAIARLVRERRDELAELLTDEVGKPVAWSRGEVDRLALTFDLAARLCPLYGRESLPLDFDPRGPGYQCSVERFPVGVVLGIVPWNWPFNLAAHKIAPALATGNTVVLKPSQQSAMSTLALAKLIHEAGCPPGVLNCVNVSSQIAQRMVEDPRVAIVSFTGSPEVGWKLKGLVPEKKVSLELGGDASAIVCDDADLVFALPRLVAGGYGYAGQVCIAVQHVRVEARCYERVRETLAHLTAECPAGDPRDEQVVCGPLISSEAADRVMEWIEEAVSGGAWVLAGGTRNGNVVAPTLIESVPAGARLACEEVFGPVLTLQPFEAFEEALDQVNASPFGLQCGVFTRDPARIERAFRTLEVGGVVVNDFPTLRFDNMPYGGVKRSGFGREGVRYAMDEMTEPKVRLERA